MNRYRLTRRVAILGIAANTFLLIIKLIVGFMSRSQAMIADGFNSAGDVFASTMTYVGNKIASRPEDTDHPFGHGKAEYIFSMIISFSLIIVSYKILRNSLNSIMNQEIVNYSIFLVVVAVITIILKLILFIYTSRVGLKENNLLILANAEDHRNDVFVSSSTLLSIILGRFGLYWLDGVIGVGIALWIAFTGIKIFRSSFIVLMDTSISDNLKTDVNKVIKSIDGVDHIDSISAKPVGVGYIIIAKVSVIGTMTVNESHSIAAQIKVDVMKCKDIKDVIVHVNPV